MGTRFLALFELASSVVILVSEHLGLLVKFDEITNV
jgi:hypothetical protein